MAYLQQWNFNVQTEVKTILLEAGYVGTRGSHLSYGSYNLNAIPLSQSTVAQGQFIAPYVPYPQYPQGVTVNTWIGSSDYNALQIKAERRFANGLAFVLSYTWSKNMDVGNAGYRDPVGNRNLDRGLSGNNAANRVVTAYNYQLPIGRPPLVIEGHSGQCDRRLANQRDYDLSERHLSHAWPVQQQLHLRKQSFRAGCHRQSDDGLANAGAMVRHRRIHVSRPVHDRQRRTRPDYRTELVFH